MPRFIDTSGYSTIAIGVCDRCKMKRPLAVLESDPNFPGLRVCDQGCKDQFDPYRLPARKTEKIALRFPRPDVSVATNDDYLITTGYGTVYISTEQNTQVPEESGNLDTIAPSPPNESGN